MKITRTSKLFFDKYVFKIVITNPLSFEFRDKNLSKVLLQLEKIAKEVELSPSHRVFLNTWNKKIIHYEECKHAINIHNLLSAEPDNFTLRIESSHLGIYSNDEEFIKKIQDFGRVIEISKPANDKIKDFLLKNPHCIVSKKYTHKYRITVNPLREAGPDFHSWAENIPSIKLLKRTYRSEGYFYAANEKTLGLCRLFLGGKIRRIDTMYLESEI